MAVAVGAVGGVGVGSAVAPVGHHPRNTVSLVAWMWRPKNSKICVRAMVFVEGKTDCFFFSSKPAFFAKIMCCKCRRGRGGYGGHGGRQYQRGRSNRNQPAAHPQRVPVQA